MNQVSPSRCTVPIHRLIKERQSQTSFSTQQNGLQSTYAQPPTPVHLPSIWNEPAKLPERSYTSNTNNTNDFPPSPGPGAMQPFQAPPPAQYAVAQQQQQQQLGPPPIAPKKNFGGLGGTLGHALVGGVGFGAGSAVAVSFLPLFVGLRWWEIFKSSRATRFRSDPTRRAVR